MGRGIHTIGTANARFRPKLKRKPRTDRSGCYRYCPTMLTKHPELDRNEKVKIIEISGKKIDPTVKVCSYEDHYESGEYTVMWEDLRR